MARARPATSVGVSPFIRSATAKPAICASVAAPSMISFMAQAASSEVSDSPLTSAPIRAGQLVLASTGKASGLGYLWALGPAAHQPRQLPGQPRRIDRVADHRVGPGPGGEPPVVGAADDQQDRRAVVDLVLGLAADAHPARGLGLAVQHHHFRDRKSTR